MQEKIVLIGAGSAMFTRGVVSDLIRSGLNGTLALVDIDPEALKVGHSLAEKMIAARGAEIHLIASLDRRQVLPGATVVITTIGVGGRRAWENDVLIPRQFGLFYPVGDTVGPGGTSRALRMIPEMVAIAQDVLELAPQALFFNYANPMAPICSAVRKTTGAEIVGLCIGAWDTWLYLSKVLNVAPKNLAFSAGGINHLTWFSEMRVNGIDAMPQLRQIAEARLTAVNEAVEKANQGVSKIPHCGSPFDSSMDFPFSWQCLVWFEAYPAPQDRHITEFFPQFFRQGNYYGKRLGIDEFSFEGTISEGDQIYTEMRADALDPQPLTEAYFQKLGGEHEQVIGIIQAIRQNQPRRFFANLPNLGQVPNLPAGAVVETPALTGAHGLQAIIQKPLPTAAAGMLATRYQWVDMVIEAALEGSRTKFINALILDGAVQSPDQAVALADALLTAQRAFLPRFKI